MTDTHSIRFLTRQACPLCEEALASLSPIADRYHIPVEVVDVDLDMMLLDVYNERVPVVEYRGRVIAEGAIDADTLRQDIESLRRP